MMLRNLAAMALLATVGVQAQDAPDLDALMAQNQQSQEIPSTFATQRVVLMPSVETSGKNNLVFQLSHRFGTPNNGLADLAGFDQARIRLGFTYGITDKLDVFLERSNSDPKPVDLGAKWHFLTQTSDGKVPLSLALHGAWYYSTLPGYARPYDMNFNRRSSAIAGLMIARRWGDFSLQVTPWFVHRYLVPTSNDANQMLAGSIGTSYRVTKRMMVNAEVASGALPRVEGRIPAVSLGMDFDTGGHVFQLYITNAALLSEDRLMTETLEAGDNPLDVLRLGFNLTRTFALGS